MCLETRIDSYLFKRKESFLHTYHGLISKTVYCENAQMLMCENFHGWKLKLTGNTERKRKHKEKSS